MARFHHVAVRYLQCHIRILFHKQDGKIAAASTLVDGLEQFFRDHGARPSEGYPES